MGREKKADRRLLTEEEWARLKAKLGLPDQVIDSLRHQRRLSRFAPFVGALALYAWMVLMGQLIPVLYSSEFARLLILLGVLPTDVIMARLSYFAPMGMTFAGLVLGISLVFTAIRSWPVLQRQLLVSTLRVAVPRRRSPIAVDMLRPVVRLVVRSSLKPIDQSLPPNEYLEQFERNLARAIARIALVLFLLTLPAFAWELESIDRITPAGFTFHSDYGTRELSNKWSDVVRIRTKCPVQLNKPFLRYTLEFADGQIAELESYRPIGRSWLEALSLVDRRLTALNVPKVQDRIDQECLDGWRRELEPEEFERLQRLL